MDHFAGRLGLLDDGADELLLPGDPGEVGDDVAQDMPGSHERQGLRAVHVVAAGVRQMEAGQRVLHRLVDADRHAAHGVDQPLETVEVELDVMVDGQPRELLHRLYDDVRTVVEGRVDLAEAVTRDVHSKVTRDAENGGVVVDRVDPHQDDRVGSLAGALRRGSERMLFLLGEARTTVASQDQKVADVLHAWRRDVREAVAMAPATGVELRHVRLDVPDGGDGEGRARRQHDRKDACHQQERLPRSRMAGGPSAPWPDGLIDH